MSPAPSKTAIRLVATTAALIVAAEHPLRAEYYDYHPATDSMMFLGADFTPGKFGESSSRCYKIAARHFVDFTQPSMKRELPVKTTGPDTPEPPIRFSYKTTYVETEQQLAEALEIDAHINASTLSFDLEAALGLRRQTQSSVGSITQVTTIEIENSREFVELEPAAGVDHRSNCGTHVINMARRGVSASIIIRVYGDQTIKTDETSASLNAGYDSIAFEANVNVNFIKALRSAAASGNFDVSIFTKGGDIGGNEALLAMRNQIMAAVGSDASKDLTTTYADFVADLADDLKGKLDRPVYLGFWSRPAPELVDEHQLFEFSTYVDDLAALKRSYRETRSRLDEIDGIRNGRDPRSSFYASPFRNQLLAEFHSEMEQYKSRVRRKHTECRSEYEKVVRKAAQERGSENQSSQATTNGDSTVSACTSPKGVPLSEFRALLPFKVDRTKPAAQVYPIVSLAYFRNTCLFDANVLDDKALTRAAITTLWGEAPADPKNDDKRQIRNTFRLLTPSIGGPRGRYCVCMRTAADQTFVVTVNHYLRPSSHDPGLGIYEARSEIGCFETGRTVDNIWIKPQNYPAELHCRVKLLTDDELCNPLLFPGARPARPSYGLSLVEDPGDAN